MQTQHKNEKGALLVEVIAVLGLIALITPILFHQVQRRNEEIVDIQIATEMRAVKDAVSAYIQANERDLAKDCGLTCPSDDLTCTNISDGDYGDTGENEIDCGITAGSSLNDFFSGDSDILDDYNYDFYAYTVKQGDDSYRPVIYALIAQKTPMKNLRRASKVASLIGLEGGIVYESTGDVHGMQGVWTSGVDLDDVLDGNLQGSEAVVVATTAFDDATNSAILKDATFSHMQASGSVQAPIVASEKLGIKDILTVDDTENCILDYKNDSVTINSNGTGSCAPFFEVNPATKEVHLAGVIKTGKETDATCSSGTTKESCEDIANCVWVTKTCDKQKSKTACAALTGCTWTDETKTCSGSTTGECLGEYLLNPSETSMMDDIKLSSRGGAKLSEILPNWILKSTTYKGFDNFIEAAWEIPVPSCPTSYKPGVLILSSGMQGYVQTVNAKAIAGAIRNTDGTVLEPDDFSSTYQNNGIAIDGALRYVVNYTNSTLPNNPPEGLYTQETPSVETWKIHPQYWLRTSDDKTGHWQDIAGSLSDIGVSAVIQTYCVATASIFTTETACKDAGYTWSSNSCN